VTDITPLSFRSSLEEYQKQAEELFEALRAGDPGAIASQSPAAGSTLLVKRHIADES